MKLNALINHDQIEIFSTVEFLIEEGLNYKFKKDKRGNSMNTPVDGNDHGVTALEFIIVELPHNLKELRLSAYLPTGAEIVHDKMFTEKKAPLPAFDPLKEESNGNFNVPNSSLATDRNRTYAFASTIYDNPEEDDGEDERPGTLGSYIPGRR